MRTTILLTLALLGAGCITATNEPAEDADDPAVVPAADATPREDAKDADDPAPSPPPAQEETPPAGNASASPKTPPPAPEPSAPSPREEQVTGTASMTLTASPPCNPPAPCEAGVPHEPAALDLPQARPSRAVLGATWTPTVAAFDTLALNVTTPEGVVVGSVSGASPLVLELDPALVGDATRLLVGVAPGAPGVAARQEVALVLDLRYA